MREPASIQPAGVTDGRIAEINLRSGLWQAWSTFWRCPERPGIAEVVLEQELLTAQFLGDAEAFDRLDNLVGDLLRANPQAGASLLVAAQVACATHRFAEADSYLAEARKEAAPAEAAERLALTLDQATGRNLERVLEARRLRTGAGARWGELVPLGALLADLGAFEEAEAVYCRALLEYGDLSPFAPAWACFELGVLWGERVPTPRAELAAQWYTRAIEYLPGYVKARVHLAEILNDRGDMTAARAVLEPAIASGDPEVYWCLAEAAGSREAAGHLEAARRGFDSLLARHPLAYADHAAEFFLSAGADPQRALALAQQNCRNRPTLRAYGLAHEAAEACGNRAEATELLAGARQRWAGTAAFANCPLAAYS